MVITEVIAKLKEILEEGGDLDCQIYCVGDVCYLVPIGDIEIEKTEYKKEKVVVFIE